MLSALVWPAAVFVAPDAILGKLVEPNLGGPAFGPETLGGVPIEGGPDCAGFKSSGSGSGAGKAGNFNIGALVGGGRFVTTLTGGGGTD